MAADASLYLLLENSTLRGHFRPKKGLNIQMSGVYLKAEHSRAKLGGKRW